MRHLFFYLKRNIRIYIAYILIFIYYRRHIFFSNLNYLVCNIPTSSSIHMHTLSLSTLRHIHVLKILDTVIFFLNMYSMYARYRYGTVHMVYTVHNMCICMVYKSYIYIFFFQTSLRPYLNLSSMQSPIAFATCLFFFLIFWFFLNFFRHHCAHTWLYQVCNRQSHLRHRYRLAEEVSATNPKPT